MQSKKVVIPTGFGINCEAETAYAFRKLGAEVDTPHLNDLIAEPARLTQAQIMTLAGGFSFGDHLGAGLVLANRLRRRLGPALQAFVDQGGLVLGICNGFQTLVRLGLLPRQQLGTPQASLAPNAAGHHYYDGWVRLAADPESPCIFTRNVGQIELPVRHGEGRLLLTKDVEAEALAQHLVPLRYVDDQGATTESYPENPNGSPEGRAALCDPSGRIFGLMPHPEAYLFPENHPQWRRGANARAQGWIIFENALAHATR